MPSNRNRLREEEVVSEKKNKCDQCVPRVRTSIIADLRPADGVLQLSDGSRRRWRLLGAVGICSVRFRSYTNEGIKRGGGDTVEERPGERRRERFTAVTPG